MVSVKAEGKADVGEVKQLDNSDDDGVVHPVVPPIAGLELDAYVDVTIRPADLWTGGLYIEGCAIIRDQVVARLGLEYAGLRVGKTPVSAAGVNFTCRGRVGLVCGLLEGRYVRADRVGLGFNNEP